MLEGLIWLLLVEAMGLVALPIAMRLFRFLPDRGYAFAKPLGLLLVSYVVWLLGSFGLLRNEAVSILAVMALVAAVSARLYAANKADIQGFLRAQRRHIVTVELIFVAAFAIWALFRAYNPALDATERPMDLAFLNAILRSDRFPPNDPWLSGFAISYYYFGYLMMAMLAKLSGIAGAVSFNLSIALLFAWTITGAFSLVYNLIERVLIAQRAERRSIWENSTLFGLLSSFLVAVIGNLHILLDVLRARGLDWPGLWEWLDLKRIASAPVTGRWLPTDPPDNWWWWRASRVIHDRTLTGQDSEVIDEFPFFSFLLGDMHPHVLGLPFVLLALGLALNVLFGFVFPPAQREPAAEGEGRLVSFVTGLWGQAIAILRNNVFDIALWALCLGGLSFLNTWDFPIYLFIFVCALGLRRYVAEGRLDLWELLIYAGWVFALGVLAYLPFYVGFRSQAGGILPVLYNVTRLSQYLIMFGLFILALLGFVVHQGRELLAIKTDEGQRWLNPKAVVSRGAQAVVAVTLLPLAIFALGVLLITATSQGQAFVQELLAQPEVQAAVGGQNVSDLLRQFLMMRLQSPWMFLLLVVMLTALALMIWKRLRLARETGLPAGSVEPAANTSAIFVGLIAGMGLLLTLVTEFIYLRDFFGTRMNTIFKFWYQAWVQMAIASAFAVWYVMRRGRRVGGYIWLGAFMLLFGISLLYPIAGMYSKGQQFAVKPTLNGIAYMEQRRPGDYRAIQWLNENVQGAPVILEAPGGSYSEYGRVSAQTGLPTVLGWDFHQQQWRGNYDEPGKRIPDIERIYKSLDRQVVQDLLEKYDIEYVYVGELERTKYGLQTPMINKFDRFMDVVYDDQGVTIYRRR